jgi:FlaA1/EpsC-like NDP-sugar epimerase
MDICLSVGATLFSVLSVKYFIHTAITWTNMWQILGLSCIVSLLCFYVFSTHYNIIRHSSLKGVWKIGLATFTKTALMFVILYWLRVVNLNNNTLLLAALFDLLLTTVLLIGIRVVMLLAYDWILKRFIQSKTRILIYGSSDKSVALKIRLHKSEHYQVVGFINYGKNMTPYRISELPSYTFCNQDEFEKVVEDNNIDAILFATHSDVLDECERLILYCEKNDNRHIRTLIAPQLDEFIGTNSEKNKIREVRVEDLLGREEINISMDKIRENFSGKRILITGAAGSIGSELCRQLSSFDIEQLVMFDNAETPLHNLRLELEKKFPDLNLTPMIGDVRQEQRLDVAFRKYRPQIVFHAAAYKHVPLMEENPCEAVSVNVAGTHNVADKCLQYDVEKMVMISTDKAVNPTNIMGCTKRLAEIYVQSLGTAVSRGKIKGGTKFVTTRFGNVLGSNGSVIPLFREQIASGGPVTVTHPDIIRFFMTIPEACRLVMEAATICECNQIMVFDMGKPVKIADLATKMIKLAGLSPDKDIKIEYTGLRLGEKLYEEVLSDVENTLPTSHDRIRIAAVRQCDYSYANDIVGRLETFAKRYEIDDMVRLMKEAVPEYNPQNSLFEQLVENGKV